MIKYKDSKKIIINPITNNSKEIILNLISGNSIKIEIKEPKVPEGILLIYPEYNKDTKKLVNFIITYLHN